MRHPVGKPAAAEPASGGGERAAFDLQAHRGGLGLRSEYFHGPVVQTLRKRDGLKVVPYTVNDAPTMQRLIDPRVDGIISDDPDLPVAVARRNGLR